LNLLCNENYLASAGKDRTIKVYKLIYFDREFKSGSLDKLQLALNINEAHTTEITALGSSPNMMFSMSSTGELKIWDIYDGQLFRTMKNYSGWGFRIMYLFSPIEDL
jgi:WD40 repeat protein